MRASRVLAKLRSGEVASCFKINLADPRVVEIAAQAGFDCLWACLEHVPNSLSTLEQFIWAAKTQNTDLLVRVSRGSYSDYIRPMEMDAAGIMVPHCMSGKEARDIARITRFHPLGLRPLDGGNADAAYSAVPLSDYMEQANRERMVVVQIEDPEPLEELDAIAATPGIDMLFFGPGDFSQAIGVPGKFDDPRLLDARKRVADAALRHNKFAATVAVGGNMEQCLEEGYRFISMGADVLAILSYCQDIMRSFQTSPTEQKASSLYGK